MKLTDFATELVSKNNFIKASFGGFQGAGKSRTATEFIIGAYKDMKCKKPILIIDNEKGSRFLIPIFKKAGIEAIAKDTTSLADVIQAFDFIQKGEVDFLFIDSMTKIYYKFVRDYKAKNRKSFMALNDWGKLLPAWQEEFSDRFVNTDGNIVFTGRGGFEYEKEEDTKDENGVVVEKGSFVKSGIKMKIAGETPYETDLNIWMQLEKEITKDGKPKQLNVAYVLKDRSDTINGKIFEMPKYKSFKPIINFILGLPIGDVAQESTNVNLTPGNDFDYYERLTNRKIEIEKIESLFELNNLGSPRSAEEKKIKTMIIQKIFGTTSKTEIEKMDAAQLNFKRSELDSFFNAFSTVDDDKISFIESYNIAKEQLFAV
ncbi:MAG: ATP-binding protein [Bacteroidetes bacterium]|nr:ATP-binding protein [Bacteroidota bacterium]